jgi:hypothetical protein
MPNSNLSPISSPGFSDRLMGKDGTATLDMVVWMEAISEAVNNASPLVGTGSPEGVEIASAGRWYVDTADLAGQGIYFKETGTGGTGWIKRS